MPRFRVTLEQPIWHKAVIEVQAVDEEHASDEAFRLAKDAKTSLDWTPTTSADDELEATEIVEVGSAG